MTPLPRLESGLAHRLRGVFRKAVGSGKHAPQAVWFLPRDRDVFAVLATADLILTRSLSSLRLNSPACIPWPKFSKPSGPLELEHPSGEAQIIPAVPEEWSENDAKLLTAFDEADGAAAKEGSRYALHRIQVRGKRGEVVATDSKQALIWGGWSFPFADDILVARTSVIGSPEFASVKEVKVGRTKTHLVVEAGDWTAFLVIDTSGRFPDVNSIVPPPATAGTRLWLDPAEAEVLVTALSKLPGRTDDSSPVTLDLGNHVVLCARGKDESRATVVPLPASRAVGPSLCLAIDRRHLARACRLGCREIDFTTADKPMTARVGPMSLVWMPLPGGGLSTSSSDTRMTLAAISGKSVKTAPRVSNEQPVTSPAHAAVPPTPAALPSSPRTSQPSRAGFFDTLVAGSNWLLSTIRLKSLSRIS